MPERCQRPADFKGKVFKSLPSIQTWRNQNLAVWGKIVAVFFRYIFLQQPRHALGAYIMRPGDCYVILVVWYPCPPTSRIKKRVVTTPGLGELPNPELWSTCVQSKLFCIKRLQWSTWAVMFFLCSYIPYSDSIYLVSLVASATWNPFRFH